MPYGKFTANGIYTITTPRTPDVWSNFLFNLEYNRNVSQTGQGAAARSRPVRRETNRSLRLFYLKDHATGVVWNPNYTPLCGPLDSFECDHALGHTEIRSRAHGVASALTTFIPREGAYELWLWRVTNTTASPITLSLYAGLGMLCERPMGSEGLQDEKTGALIAWAFPGHVKYDDALLHLEKIPRQYWTASRRADSWTTSERQFFGVGDPLAYAEVPDMVRAPRLNNTGSVWHSPLAVLAHEITLQPGETFTNAYQGGLEFSLPAIQAHAAALTVAGVEAELAKTQAYWESITQLVQIETPDADINQFINTWVKKQMIWQTECRRNASAFPIRNVLQDAMGYSLLDPAAALRHARDMLSLQNADGSIEQWTMAHPSLPKHQFTQLHHNDGPVWLVLCTLVMVRQTGEDAFFDQPVPYSNGGVGPVFEHLTRALFALAADRGRHGLCRMHDGDWTDPINGPGRKGEGESVWLTQGLLYIAKEMRLLPRVAAHATLARSLDALIEELHAAINQAWDGDWYAYGYDDEGVPFGVSTDTEGRIFLNAQTWALISGCAEGERARQTIAAIDSIDSDCGPRICWPPFTTWSPRVGRLSLKLPGTSENGAVYCHGTVFKAFAEARMGDADRALASLIKIMPTNPKNPPEKNYQVPTYIPNSYYGIDSKSFFGESTLHHETGTASWYFMTIVEELLGLRATTEGLRLSPLLPTGWDGYKARRQWSGCAYSITVTGYKKDVRPALVCNGRPLTDNLLPREPGATYDIEVTYP